MADGIARIVPPAETCPGLAIARSAPPHRPSPGRERPLMLLIADEPMVARFIAHAAEEHGYDARVTISASAFRREYDSDPPDAVAIDLAMPGGDGIELLRFLAERESKATVLIVSGFDERVLDAAMRRGTALGLRMAGPLHKPMRVSDLIEAIAPGEALVR